MAAKKPNAALSELRAYLRKHPDTWEIEIMVPDIAGVLRAKRIRAAEFEKIFGSHFYMPGGAVLLDTLGNTVPDMRWSSDDGDPDTEAHIVPGTLAPIPWSRKPTGQALFSFYMMDGTPFFADPRHVLAKAIAPLRKLAPTIVMACELEFYLLKADADQPTPRVSVVPGVGRPQPGPQVYSPDDLWDIEAFLDELHEYCEQQNIPAGTTISEFAPGQFEINLHHVDDPLRACDHAVLLKRAIKAAARKHGYVACFMAKPFRDESGSGLHIHMSLVDKDGRNYFSEGKDKLTEPPYSPKLRHAIGGLAKTMAEATAIFAPNANSYRRLRPESFAPVEPNWGPNHRSVSLRIPISGAKDLRFEHRTSGADANPYLVTAAIAAGVHYGITNKCEPGPMVEEGQVITLERKIPNRWCVAIDRFEESEIMREYLGKEFCASFVKNRRYEERMFHNIISSTDFDWYLRAV